MDVLAPTTMKNAAKCDTSCELQNPVSHQNFERILHFLWGVCLLECLFIPTNPSMGHGVCRLVLIHQSSKDENKISIRYKVNLNSLRWHWILMANRHLYNLCQMLIQKCY